MNNKNFIRLILSIFLYVGTKLKLTRNYLNISTLNNFIKRVKNSQYKEASFHIT